MQTKPEMETINTTTQDLEGTLTRTAAESTVISLLQLLDPEPYREGLKDTPRRVAKFYKEFVLPEPFTFTTFDAEGYDEMILVDNIPFYSLCEHHLAPFFGTAAVAYIPGTRMVGLSKIPRTVDAYARRLQNQERMTVQIARAMETALDPRGVAVMIKARHLCMEMRGIKKPGAETTTIKVTGLFMTDEKTRAEFLSRLK
jgi:GTP cyclohydrolase I